MHQTTNKMTQEQFDIITTGLVNPSIIKVAVNKGYDLLMSAENTNDTMTWFNTNSDKLEENLRKQNLKWAYIIETCPDGEPFIYMLISPTMSTYLARNLTQRVRNTLPDDRTMLVSEGRFKAFNIEQFDYTPTTITDLLAQYADTVLKVSEV